MPFEIQKKTVSIKINPSNYDSTSGSFNIKNSEFQELLTSVPMFIMVNGKKETKKFSCITTGLESTDGSSFDYTYRSTDGFTLTLNFNGLAAFR